MTYKTAEKLKKAKFPFLWNYEPQALAFREYPSLSELIEACGDDLDILERDGDGGWQAATPMTTVDAGCGCCYDTKKTCEQGKTPEEAVASLFLRLNDKK